MNLLVDLGNSRIKWAQSGPGLWRTAANLMPSQAIGTMLDRLWADLSAPEKVVVSSVTNVERLEDLQQWLKQRWSLRAHVVRAEKELLGVKNNYHDPTSLGADRWVALIAARRLTSRPVCIVDCGTAVTIDALSTSGDFLGGVIFPGLRLLRVSLTQATEGVHETYGDDTSCFGRSTAECVAAGSGFGLAGAIERVVWEYREQLGEAIEVLVTGADAPALLPRVRVAAKEIPDLVLRGLALIADEVV